MYPLVRKILIADDHPLLRRALRQLITAEFRITNISEAASFSDVLRELEKEEFSHLILDLVLDDVNSAEKFIELHRNYPGLAVLIYSMHPADLHAGRFLKAGARGYLSKSSGSEEVIATLELFFTGKRCKPQVAEENTSPFQQLSARELEVLPHLLNGRGIKETAVILGLKPNTVATFKARIFSKLEVNNLIELNQLTTFYHYLHP